MRETTAVVGFKLRGDGRKARDLLGTCLAAHNILEARVTMHTIEPTPPVGGIARLQEDHHLDIPAADVESNTTPLTSSTEHILIRYSLVDHPALSIAVAAPTRPERSRV